MSKEYLDENEKTSVRFSDMCVFCWLGNLITFYLILWAPPNHAAILTQTNRFELIFIWKLCGTVHASLKKTHTSAHKTPSLRSSRSSFSTRLPCVHLEHVCNMCALAQQHPVSCMWILGDCVWVCFCVCFHTARVFDSRFVAINFGISYFLMLLLSGWWLPSVVDGNIAQPATNQPAVNDSRALLQSANEWTWRRIFVGKHWLIDAGAQRAIMDRPRSNSKKPWLLPTTCNLLLLHFVAKHSAAAENFFVILIDNVM